MTRELKLALIVGFSLVLIVTVLISDHLSKARRLSLEPPIVDRPYAVIQTEPAPTPTLIDPAPTLAQDTTPPSEPSGPPAPTVATRDAAPAGPAHEVVTFDQRLDRKTVIPASLPMSEPIKSPIVERFHTVVEGDNLYQIAKKYYGTSGEWSKIAQANNIKPEGLKLGMKLRLPGLSDERVSFVIASPAPAAKVVNVSKAPEPTKARSQSYTVKAGDTLQGIARKTFGSTQRVAEIIRLNGIEDEDSLTPGATLKLPNP